MKKATILTAAEAAAYIKDGMTVVPSGFVGSCCPEALNKAVEQRFLETGSPKDLTLLMVSAQGNRDGSGGDHYAHEGLVKRVIGGHWNLVPELGKLALAEKSKPTHFRRVRYHSFAGKLQHTIRVSSPMLALAPSSIRKTRAVS